MGIQLGFWTNTDMARFVAVQQEMIAVDNTLWCKDCLVIPAVEESGRCLGCEVVYINTVVDYLAATYTEQGQVEKGLY